MTWGDAAGQALRAKDEDASAFTATNTQGALLTVTPNADGSGTINGAFPRTSANVDYFIKLSAPRKLGFGDGRGGLAGARWQGGAEFRQFDWVVPPGGHMTVFYGPN